MCLQITMSLRVIVVFICEKEQKDCKYYQHLDSNKLSGSLLSQVLQQTSN